MRRLPLAVLLAVAPLLGWNHVGHKAVAGLAYERLTGTARAKVDALIRSHPDYQSWLALAPADEKLRARHAFIQSAYWPDTIKGDLRFYDEARPDPPPTPTLPGFPDMKRRSNWHYINIAFSPDGTPFPPPPKVNALAQIQMILGVMGGEKSATVAEQDPVYLLPWLLHLAGDVHNPMHCTSRWKKDQLDPRSGKPWSDLGGNGVSVVGSYNLHAFWDDALGITDTPAFVDGLIKFLDGKGADGADVTDPQAWVNEGAKLAESFAYSFGPDGGSKDHPIKLTDEYVLRAKEIARERAALAGRRLAAVLNERFR